MPPRSWLLQNPATSRAHVAWFRHLSRDSNRVTLSIVDRLGRRSAAHLIPANVFRLELQVRIDGLQVGFARRRDPVQASSVSAQGLVERFGPGALVPTGARHGVVPFVGCCVSAGIAPVDPPEIPTLVAADGLESAMLP